MAEIKDTDVLFVDRRYGKNYVRLLYVKRVGTVHDIKEVEVSTALTLNDARDYLQGDNSKIVATDSQKNTVYILAKKLGIRSIEEFACQLSDHFLHQYDHVIRTNIYIEEKPWQRIEIGGKKHNHAFVQQGGAVRVCQITQNKHEQAVVKGGLKDLTVMKTTQSAFVNFVRDEYRSLPDMDDRVFCTIVDASWQYGVTTGLNFDDAWETVKNAILDVFAGPADTGIFSPSVQKTLYDTQKRILTNVPQIDDIEIILPNVHAYEFDYSKYPGVGIKTNGEVFMPTDKPSGNIRAKLQRKVKAKI